MGTVKDTPFSKQTHPNAGTFALAQFCPKAHQQRFDVAPFDTATAGFGKYLLKRLVVFALHS
jgi:hypothetical protein